jgi:NhaP-type Na+/H+ or K+/H+ antiporter
VQLYINEVVLGTAFGIIMGPYCADIFDPRSWGSKEHEITLEIMRIVLATGLFAIGVELPKAYLREHIRGLSVMVIPTMAFGWVVVAGTSCTDGISAVATWLTPFEGILKALMPNLDYVSCLAISACLTPTDPIISAAIVGMLIAIRFGIE